MKSQSHWGQEAIVSRVRLSRDANIVIALPNGIKTIAFPREVQRVQLFPLDNIYSLRSVVLNDGFEVIESGMFARSSLRAIFVPASVRQIGNAAFS